MLRRIVLLVCFFACLRPGPTFAQTKSTTAHVDFTVICDDEEIREKLTSMLRTEVMKNPDLIWDAKLPARKLFLYAQKDINDRKNPNGWSFAISHVSNLPNQILAARLMKCDVPQCEEVKKLAYAMVKEEGMLKHMNVAHLDEVSDATLTEFVATIFATFAQKAKGL